MSSALFSACARAPIRGPPFPQPPPAALRLRLRLRAAAGDSYLDMWKNAVEQERKAEHFQRIADKARTPPAPPAQHGHAESLDEKTDVFNRILDGPREERDRAQRLQVIDRAGAAIAAVRALFDEAPPPSDPTKLLGNRGRRVAVAGQRGFGTPGPDFWLWSPSLESNTESRKVDGLQPARKLKSYPNAASSLMVKEQADDFLPIPFESSLFQSKHEPPLPPFQSLTEVEKLDTIKPSAELPTAAVENKIDILNSKHAEEAAEALERSAETLERSAETLSHGENPDGSKWWRETGTEQRPDGVVCKWTLMRGVSADETIEWEDKYWEAADQFGHKELGSEKRGRDATGNVWCEFWKESMWQDLRSGLTHIEKTADKWGKNGRGGEWQEKWLEQYDASGKAEKWAHKWCCIDPNTLLEAGHAHVWHERWGEKYDGKGGIMKYTDKWAERSEGDGWSKWGDKWDEHFDPSGCGVKQGETWWQGKYGERWNRTWGEQHNGSGWVHKYGKGSSGEHWDTHVQQDTWYEPYPHYDFERCYENSVQLRAVRSPPQINWDLLCFIVGFILANFKMDSNNLMCA